MPGRVSLQGQDRATCCIAHPFGGYAAKTLPRPVLIPAPFRRSHTAKANPLRGIASQIQNRSALRICWLESARVLATLDCTPPGRGKSQAIEHNRALPKVGQSLRRLRLVAYRWRALWVRVMVGYVLRPSPDNSYVGAAVAAFGSSGAARGWGGSLPRRWARSLAGVAGGQLVVPLRLPPQPPATEMALRQCQALLESTIHKGEQE